MCEYTADAQLARKDVRWREMRLSGQGFAKSLSLANAVCELWLLIEIALSCIHEVALTFSRSARDGDLAESSAGQLSPGW